MPRIETLLLVMIFISYSSITNAQHLYRVRSIGQEHYLLVKEADANTNIDPSGDLYSIEDVNLETPIMHFLNVQLDSSNNQFILHIGEGIAMQMEMLEEIQYPFQPIELQGIIMLEL